MRNLFTFSLIILSVITFSECLGGGRSGSGSWSSGSRAAKYDGQRYSGFGGQYAQQYPNYSFTKESNKTTGKPPSGSRGIGISAWGIVGIILSVIFLSAGTYYFIIFYPLVCKKERNYDVMELSPV